MSIVWEGMGAVFKGHYLAVLWMFILKSYGLHIRLSFLLRDTKSQLSVNEGAPGECVEMSKPPGGQRWK